MNFKFNRILIGCSGSEAKESANYFIMKTEIYFQKILLLMAAKQTMMHPANVFLQIK